MKITELKCTACHGTMKVDPDNPDYAVCEYCGTKFLIEKEKTGEDSSLSPKAFSYKPIAPVEQPKNGWEFLGWKRNLALMLSLIVVVGVMILPVILRGNNKQDILTNADLIDYTWHDPSDDTADEESKAVPRLEGGMAYFAEYVFNQPVDAITEKQLADIKWLEFKHGEIGYSLESPWENPEAELIWVNLPEDLNVNLSSLPLFTGLKKLESNQSISKEYLQGLSLEGIGGYFDNLEEVAALVDDPAAIRDITMKGDALSFQGSGTFSNLENLYINCGQIEDPKALITIKSLKSLSIDMYDQGIDFSVFGMMPWIERVTISSEKLKDLSFVTSMSGLKELNITYGTFLNLEPLKNCTGLETLSVVRCEELKDMSALAGLTNLKKLRIDLPYDCPEPDLSALSAMEDLYLEGFEKTSFLRNMPQLKNMTLDSCIVNEPSDFEGLVNLTTLNCTSFGISERDYGFITRLPAIQNLNLRGTITYKDISGIFNLPTLKYLNIGSMECEINFDNIQENTTLETLVIDKMKLYENLVVRGGGGIYSVSWDDVILAEHLSFLEKLKNLNTLSIQKNELTDLGFASSLAALRSIDFSDNYVTDLSPLSELTMLREITCTENPISNFEVLSESVLVIP